ncbi:MAG TPA: HAMP domain-containing histidine kinase [Clostridiaceae bacterium]|nr:HAMP domain-containing histidine kinase [Clostridiaceae bacterium]
MKSIRTRIAVNFIFIVLITVLLLESLIINVVKQNYYKNLKNTLHNHLKVSVDLYYRYFSDTSLQDNVLNNVDTFWKQVPVQVEIIDTTGKILMDSIGVMPEDVSMMDDYKEALKGNVGSWMGKVNYDSEMVMSVSYPLRSRSGIVGVLRFITSLREVNNDIDRVSRIFLFIGLIAILVSGLVSILMAATIVRPLKEITVAAEKMASGNFNARTRKINDDEFGKLSDTLNYMAEEIIKREQLKNEFISSISHELRTPLTSIKGWAVTLKEGSPEDIETYKDGLEIIEKECDRLTAMVEELLDFSKFVSGKITIKNDMVNIANLINNIKFQLLPRAERENISFEVICPENLPVIVSDENRLKQVFINILDNAFKFTPEDGRVVFKTEYNVKELIFRISDTGCGIPVEELPRVKEKFYKGRNSNSQNGIGLSICDEIIKLMDGSLNIKSEIGKGTEVIVTLPIIVEGEA